MSMIISCVQPRPSKAVMFWSRLSMKPSRPVLCLLHSRRSFENFGLLPSSVIIMTALSVVLLSFTAGTVMNWLK